MLLFFSLMVLHQIRLDGLHELQSFRSDQAMPQEGLLVLVYFDDDSCQDCLNQELHILKRLEKESNGYSFVLVTKDISDYQLKKYTRSRLVSYSVFKETGSASWGISKHIALYLIDLDQGLVLNSYFPKIEDDLELKTRQFLP